MKIFFLIAATITVLFASSAGMPGMTTNADGHMSNCPLMGVAALCNMSPLEHIAAWQNIFAALPFKKAAALASLLLLVSFTIFFLRDFWDTSRLQSVAVHRQRFRRRARNVHDEIQEAFSDGILNPKVF